MTLKAYAKVNLALEVMDEINGYHLVNNLMAQIDLYDEISFEKYDKIEVYNDKIENNIMVKAAKLFLDTYKIDSGVLMHLKKNIPTSAGLAGGSSDAATVLLGLNELYNVGAKKEELKELAAKLGSDVPFFIEGGLALCTNKGEVVSNLDIHPNKIKLTLIKINEGLSTKEVYKNYKYLGVSKKNKIDNIIDALEKNNISKLKENIFNDLTESALFLNNILNDLYLRLNKITNIYLSGSGPTLFGLDLSREDIKTIEKTLDKDTFIYNGNITF